jgi:transcription antitermination factor NusG
MYSCSHNTPGLARFTSAPVSGIADEPRWYALQTRSRHEKKVVSELQEKGVIVYLPLIPQVRRWTDRRKTIQVPLFPCYTFVHTACLLQARSAAFQVWGALGFVGPNNQGVPIPDAEIENIRRLLTSKTALSPHAFLEVGQRVRIRGGALDGVEGILVATGGARLVISVSAIHQSLSVSIEGEGYDVQPV